MAGQRQRQRRSGAVAVEFALVAPLLFMVLFSCFEFARVSMLRHTAAVAACEAARKVVVPGATAQEAVDEANFLLGTIRANAAVVTVTPPVIDFETESVTVTVELPMDENGLLTPVFAGDSSIRCSSTHRTERYRSVSDP
jgi:Flp pilus assembly protein TadG